jgi:hypothetical protein
MRGFVCQSKRAILCSGWGIGRKPGDHAQDRRALFGSSYGRSSSQAGFPVNLGFVVNHKWNIYHDIEKFSIFKTYFLLIRFLFYYIKKTLE